MPDFATLKPINEPQPDFNTLKPVSSSASIQSKQPFNPSVFFLTGTNNSQEFKDYISRIGQDFSNAGQDITSEIQKASQPSDSVLGDAKNLGRAVLRGVGDIAGAAFSPVLQHPLVKGIIDPITNKIASIPDVQNTIKTITEVANKYPEQAKDAEAILNIIGLGGGKAIEAPLAAEGKAIANDIVQGTKAILTPSEEAIQSKVTELFTKSIKPTAKKTVSQGEKYVDDTLNALKTIKANSQQLNILDKTGEIITGRTPETINELGQGIEQTKNIVFKQYDDLAKQANKIGATIDARPIADEVLKVSQNRALQITNPEVVKYAEGWADRLRTLDNLDTETTQSIIQNMNNNLQAFYKNPTYESASKVAIDAGIANNFRVALDKSIETATGKEYQALKNQYGSLKAIENDVARAAMRDARKNTKGLLDYTDILTGGQMLTGILSLNPAMFTKGAIERGFKEFYKFLNDPNRAVNNIFKHLDVTPAEEFVPKSAVGNFVKNPKIGLSISDITKNISSAEKGTLRDFTDYVNGSYKPDEKSLLRLKRDAQEIADKYSFSAATKGDKALANQIGEYLDRVKFDKKIKK